MLCLLTALASGACSLDLSGTLNGDGGIDMDDDGIMTPGGGSGGASSGGATGAGTGSLPPPVLPSDAGVDPDGSVDPSDGGSTPQDPLVGDYAAKRAFRTQQRVQSGAIASTVRVLTTTYSAVRITQESSGYRLYERPCRVTSDADADGMLKVEITTADAVPQAFGEISSALTVSGSSGKQTFSRALTSTALGWKPASTTDKLPTTQTDTRLRDADADGKPAVTATVRSGIGVLGDSTYDAYYVQWNRVRYEGEVASDGKLVGKNFDTTEQSVLGTSTNLPNTGGKNSQPTPDPDTVDNRITLVPVPQALDCDALIDQIDSIF
jgi:hypothetical protein